ncbi:MAG: polysaccharide biosynthesis protein [Lachnospira sp.]|nr:polysaccharide biosynthesis protein [Lachnospira sp.]
MKNVFRNFEQKKKYLVVLLLVILDILSVALAEFLALLFRFEVNIADIPLNYLNMAYQFTWINILIALLFTWLLGLYDSVWAYAGVEELLSVIFVSFLSADGMYLGMKLLHYNMPRSYYVLYFFFFMILLTASRFSYRLLRRGNHFYQTRLGKGIESRVMLIGAGDAGAMILQEMQKSEQLHKKVVCIIDDDKNLRGRSLRGVDIVGGRERILPMVAKYEITEIVIAMPSASKKEISAITDICKETECKVQILPGIYQMVNEEVSVSKLRDVEIEDLLGRDPIRVDLETIADYVRDKVVLVTGGGGSIGSELCRQIASHNPKQLIIVEIYENNAYDIQQELLHHYPELNLLVLIGSVRNTIRMNRIFEKHKPQIVFHAAAHKHVPLMEVSPNEAIKNNVFGTYNCANAAHQNGVERFVLISTDKAVNPTNIMGASKRMCEMIVQMFSRMSETRFVAVRFGNVLGSNGSVIPLFRKQIAEGGPVTVTHPDIIRYFMTIPEAVSLVLQAGAYAKGGEIFVLDMGEPVKIVDLAKNLIRLSGYRVGKDIDIVYTGLRPGEKLFEEMLMDEEGLQKTKNQLIHIGKPLEFDEEQFQEDLKQLKAAAYDETLNIREAVQRIVPTYMPEKLDDRN